MKQGKVLEEFFVAGERGKKIKICFRFPKKSDAKALLSFVNRLRREAEFLGKRSRETLKSEKKFLKSRLKQIAEKKGFFLVAEANGKIIGSAHLGQSDFDSLQHVAHFGIALLEEFTGRGIGTRLAECIFGIAKKHTKWRIIKSEYFSKNARSRRLHAKLGFKKYGLLPKGLKLKNNSYDGEVKVYKVF